MQEVAPIADLSGYLSGMRKSIEDKLWFLDRIDPKVRSIYDFGCADGALLREVAKREPLLKLEGYDASYEMCESSAGNLHISNKPLKRVPRGTLINASSVFHEIYSYGTPASIKKDYDSIFNVGADYIAIRDMFYTENMPEYSDVFKEKRVRTLVPNILRDFETIHGSIIYNKNLLHFLLKYRYTDNWRREVRENYFPYSFEEFLRRIPDSYEVIYARGYILPFLYERVQEDFGFSITYPTHAKILLRRKELRSELFRVTPYQPVFNPAS